MAKQGNLNNPQHGSARRGAASLSLKLRYAMGSAAESATGSGAIYFLRSLLNRHQEILQQLDAKREATPAS